MAANNVIALQRMSRGTLFFLLLILILAIINVFTISWFPSVWVDEVGYSDPAINFVMGKGFMATTWVSQARGAFWASNAPLHQYLLIPWLKILGISVTSVRSINVLYLVLTSLVLWRWMSLSGLIKEQYIKFLLILVLWLGETMSAVFRDGRPDTITVLLAALTLLAFYNNGKHKTLFVLVVGFLSPIAGIQLPPFVVVVLAGAFMMSKEKKIIFRFGLQYVIGVFIGLTILLTFLYTQGAAYAFLTQTFASGYTMTGDVSQVVVYSDSKVWNRLLTRIAVLKNFYSTYLFDTSILLLALYLVVASIYSLFNRKDNATKALQFLIIYLVVPPLMIILGRYPFYYAWMGYLIVIIGVVFTIQHIENRLLKQLGILIVIVASIAGFPKDLLQIGNRGARKQEQISAFVQQNVTTKDWVFGDFISYYAGKKYAGEFFSVSYAGGRGLPQIPQTEKDHINKLLVYPQNYDMAVKKTGGNWVKIASLDSLSLYERQPQ